jgi:nicotinamide riboside kinase
VGGESTGKSTLATMLGDELPAVVVSEFLRTWINQHDGRVPLASEQASVMAGQHDLELTALGQAAQAGQRWVVADSGPLMTAVYSIQYYNDTSLLPLALDWVAESAFVVWCKDDFPWQPDPQRDGSHARTTSQEIISAILADHPELPVLRVDGPPSARIEAVLARARWLL